MRRAYAGSMRHGVLLGECVDHSAPFMMVPRLRRNSRLKKVAAGASRTGFGHPSRRMTDLLILANVAAFGTQLLTKQGLTVWGAKVGLAGWDAEGK